MQIIKDKQIIDDNWSHMPDDAELKAGDISCFAGSLEKR